MHEPNAQANARRRYNATLSRIGWTTMGVATLGVIPKINRVIAGPH